MTANLETQQENWEYDSEFGNIKKKKNTTGKSERQKILKTGQKNEKHEGKFGKA